MTIDEIRELIRLVSDTGIAELEVQRGDNRVRIRKSFGVDASVVMPQVVAAPTMIPAVPNAVAVPPAAPTASAASSPSTAAPTKPQSDLIYAKSPIVGTFYEASSPDSPPFVTIGQHVIPGAVLCIIESMKLMNEIEAEVAGIIESKLVQNGQPVEYGEPLFGIRPV